MSGTQISTGSPIGSIRRMARFVLLRHHTRRRSWNLYRSMQSLLLRPVHAPNMPILLKIEPSAACQLACPTCPQAIPEFRAKTRGKMMSLELFQSLLEQVGDYLYRIQFYHYGEPFINKNLLPMISAAAQRGVGSQVSTNFSFNRKDDFYRDVVESGLEHLIIAMDGLDEETYLKYRVNGKFELVEHGIREVVKWKKKLGLKHPFIEWQFIIFDHNKHQVEQAGEVAKELGVDRLCLKYDGFSDPATWQPQHARRDRLARRINLNSCLWLWGALVIDWNGVVNSCCVYKDLEHHQVGDLSQQSVKEVWNSAEIKEMRKFVRLSPAERESDEYSSHFCKGCQSIL